LSCLFVETKFLLQYERLVIGKRKADKVAGKGEGYEENDRMRNRTAETSGRILRSPDTSNGPELGEKVIVDRPNVGDLAIERTDEPEI